MRPKLYVTSLAVCLVAVACGGGSSSSPSTPSSQASGTGGTGASSSQGNGGSPQTSRTGATGTAPASGTTSATGSSGKDAGVDSGRPNVLRIMALGDSTTASTCYRAELWKLLNQNFPGRFHYVGSVPSDPGCLVPGYDTTCQGHPGCLVSNVATNVADANNAYCPTTTLSSVLGPAIAAHPADVVLLHFATNDIWNGRTPKQVTDAYSILLTSLRAANPLVTTLAARIIPLDKSQCASCPASVPPLNDAIAAWAAAKSTAASPVIVVDQYTGFDATPNVDTRDGVHPNQSGSVKMANRWYAALQPLF